MRFVHFNNDRSSIALCDSSAHMIVSNKPHEALWVSYEEGSQGWKPFCEEGGFRLYNLAFGHPVDIELDCDTLTLNTIQDMQDFTEKYGVSTDRGTMIDWMRVANHYNVLVIPRWFNKLAYSDEYHWYKCWDVACAVIFRPCDSVCIRAAQPVDVNYYEEPWEDDC